ncbi:hypothetical protein ACFJIX_18045 [Roseateles sp. UC29_93]|uniref:hypothetical protein n=1 Tax=Roseateles sp. UC29_93 TaxID=3350177 RepID=UPI003671C70D
MRQEAKDIVVELATKTVPAGGVMAWSTDLLKNINWTSVVLPGLLFILQILYLLRKWWREETAWGLKLKRWAGRAPVESKDMELDE